jgi:cystathionine beta-lyase family protein involved in aluminum resistance
MHNIFPNIEPPIIAYAQHAEEECKKYYARVEENALYNQLKVLNAFRYHKVSDYHLHGSTGYGYGDRSREVIDELYKDIFNCEKAIVRPQIVSGTHAIATALLAVAERGKEYIFATGDPYDTLLNIIGPESKKLTLANLGVNSKIIPLKGDTPDEDGILKNLTSNTSLVFIQRSRGYALRPSLNIEKIADLIKVIKAKNPDVICFVDNCYGELVERLEPTDVGADLVAGSLIKNLGGGIAPTGGYIAGKADLVELAAERLTAPGIGSEVGATSGFARLFLQGLFMAPSIVKSALCGAIFSARFFELLGYTVFPSYDSYRTDIIQTLKLDSPDKVIAFCRALQKYSPIDSGVTPEPWDMPGYNSKVIMAGGTFIQGSSIELSADAPIRPPYAVFMQGGISKEHVQIAAIHAAQEII